MNIDFAVVCDYALVDQFGKLSVIGVFHHIWVQQFPTVHPRLHLVIRLKGTRTEVGQHDVQIRLLNEQNEEIIKILSKLAKDTGSIQSRMERDQA